MGSNNSSDYVAPSEVEKTVEKGTWKISIQELQALTEFHPKLVGVSLKDLNALSHEDVQKMMTTSPSELRDALLPYYAPPGTEPTENVSKAVFATLVDESPSMSLDNREAFVEQLAAKGSVCVGKLTYFPVMAKGLPVALVCATSGRLWEGGTVNQDQWAELKPKTPFGQLPLFQTPEGLTIGQCTAIVNYVGRESETNGEHAVEKVMSDMCLAEGEDLYALLQKNSDTVFAKDKVSKEALLEFWTGEGRGTVNDHMGRLEALIQDNPKGLGFTSTGKTCGEVYMFGILYQMYLCKKDFLDAYPKVKAWFDFLLDNEEVKKVLDGGSPMGKLTQYFISLDAHNSMQ